MTEHFQRIYAEEAARYDQMVEREDYQGNLLPALNAVRPLDGLDIVEFGAGTGRFTRLLAPLAARIIACDASPHMLGVARAALTEPPRQSANWLLAAADHRHMPLRGGIADLAMAGWTFSHATTWYGERWQPQIARAIGEMFRLLRPGGVGVIVETLGTGRETPAPPNVLLADYYAWLAGEGWDHTWIRTDYQFESLDEADDLTRFFFGDALADRVRAENWLILPECTGLWWQAKP
jgi:ubiquinone/menaquinone biosynthesis C-methylase UbiE